MDSDIMCQFGGGFASVLDCDLEDLFVCFDIHFITPCGNTMKVYSPIKEKIKYMSICHIFNKNYATIYIQKRAKRGEK